MDYESVEHFLFECKFYSKFRKVLYENINEVLQLRKESSVVKISVGSILDPEWEDGVGKIQDRKQSVFQFIANTGRKLSSDVK